MPKFTSALRRSSPIVLTCLSVGGVIATSVTAAKATPKALQLIEDKKNELKVDKLRLTELIRTTWRCYIPSTLIGIGTIASIVGIGVLDRHSQASLTSAYTVLAESYNQYRKAAKKVYGEDADTKIHAEMAKDTYISDGAWGNQVYDPTMDPESECLLCNDFISRRYFHATIGAVINAQYHTNRNLQLRGYCALNEYYDFLGLERVEDGDKRGWTLDDLYENGVQWLDFDNRRTVLNDGLECIIVSVPEPIEITDYL